MLFVHNIFFVRIIQRLANRYESTIVPTLNECK